MLWFITVFKWLAIWTYILGLISGALIWLYIILLIICKRSLLGLVSLSKFSQSVSIFQQRWSTPRIMRWDIRPNWRRLLYVSFYDRSLFRIRWSGIIFILIVHQLAAICTWLCYLSHSWKYRRRNLLNTLCTTNRYILLLFIFWAVAFR